MGTEASGVIDGTAGYDETHQTSLEGEPRKRVRRWLGTAFEPPMQLVGRHPVRR
jgi:hypothetical protein